MRENNYFVIPFELCHECEHMLNVNFLRSEVHEVKTWLKGCKTLIDYCTKKTFYFTHSLKFYQMKHFICYPKGIIKEYL